MLNKLYEVDKVWIGRFSYNSDLIEELNKFCNEKDIRTGWISVIGAIKSLKLGYYDQEKQEYKTLDSSYFSGESTFEIASASGNISIKDEKPFAHIHMVITDKEGKAFGGHVMPGTIIYAGEFIIQSFKGEDLVRILDKQTNLPLWQT